MKDLILEAKSLPFDATCSYIIKYRSGKKIIYHKARNQACHSHLFSFDAYSKERCDEILGYISKCRLNPSFPKAGRKYLKWVLCESPWAYVYKTKIVKRALEDGVIFNIKAPSNLIAFGTIAYRISYENNYRRDFPKQIKLWYDCVMKGADPLVMFTFLTCMEVHKNLIHINRGGNLHGPISWSDLSQNNLRTFYLGAIPYENPTPFRKAVDGTGREVFNTLDKRVRGRSSESAYSILMKLMPEQTKVDNWGYMQEYPSIKRTNLPAFTHTFKEVICRDN